MEAVLRARFVFARKDVPVSALRHAFGRLVPQKYKLLYFVRKKAKRRGRPIEKTVLRLLCDPASVAIDVGANIGTVSYFLSRYCRETHAFEINPQLAEKLRRAKLRHTVIHEIGLSDCARTARLRIPVAAYGPVFGNATIEAANDLDARPVTELDVPVARLDDFAIADVAILKIDVEGHELPVLLGASHLLARDHPSLVVEIVETTNGASFARIFEFLKSFAYRCYRLSDNELLEVTTAQNRKGDNDYYFLLPAVAARVNAALAAP
jgi:FkbM family methyltransferase